MICSRTAVIACVVLLLATSPAAAQVIASQDAPDQPAEAAGSPITFSLFDAGMVAVTVVALAMWFSFRWNRLDRAPDRPPALTAPVVALLFAGWILLGQAGASIALAIAGAPDETPTLADQAPIVMGLYIGQALAIAAFMHMATRPPKPKRPPKCSHLGAVGVGLGALLIFWPATMVVARAGGIVSTMISGDPPPEIAHETLRQLTTQSWDVWAFLMAGMAVIAAPIAEEVGYRGLGQTIFVQFGMGRWPSIALASAIFAAMHMGHVEPHALASLFTLALGFGWSYERTGRLAAPITMHVVFNAGNLALASLL